MSNKEKPHTSHRTSMLHLRYLASFMDEIDREVVSLTDRAFKSLCIGDEAIYNDSEFCPSPVSCHKPRVEEVSKKTQESSCSAVKKLNSYMLNGGKDALGRSNQNSSKDTSHFAMFSAKKNSECTKMTNGDSWDKSALLSIQRELSEFSSDYHSLTVEQLSSAKNNLNSDEKGSAKKSSKDALIPSGKSSKCKHNKNNKLKKLNSKNFFLHSEFSPFLSWRDLNTFSIGQDHISEIMLGNGQSKWYDSPLYKELTAAHVCYKLHVTPSEDKEVEKCPKQTETHQVKEQPVQSTSRTPPNPKKETECVQHDFVTKAPLLATEQRCNSEKVETCVPWRKNKARAKSAVPVGPSLNTFPVYERSKAGEGYTQPTEKEVKTIDDQTSSNSTPFSISQLLTPVIPSRHGTGTSEILQAMLPFTALDIPPLPEREMHPSPEIKREGFKSMASSLLFNLKDNRKRVKAMYSPPKFKGLDMPGQSKESPLAEVSSSKDVLEIPEVLKATTIFPARQKNIISPMSPVLESADAQNCSPHGYTNGGVPDDYLALNLLQSGGSANRPLKSNRSPLANKVAYPSLQLYRKASPEENNLKTNCQTVVNTTSQVFTDKGMNLEHIRDRDTHSNPRKFVQSVNKEQRDKTPTVSLNTQRVYKNKSGKSSTKSDEQTISDGTHQNKDRLETSRTVSMQKSPVKEKESNKREDRAKHLFSARQNNFIKSQRFVINEDDNNDYDDSSNAGKVLLAVKDINGIDELSRHSKDAKPKEIRQDECNTGFHQDKAWTGAPILKESANVKEETMTEKQSSCISIINSETQREQVKNEPLSMKGNTYAKRALFVSMEQVANKTTVPFKKDNIVIDKYDLAKMALEEVIADREQRKLESKVVSTEKSLIIDKNRVGCDGHELSTNGDDQQTFSSKMGTNTKDEKGQNNASVFKTSSQTVQMMSEDVVTKHSESQERNRDKVNKGDKTLRLPEKGHAKVGANRGDHSECRDIHSSAQCEEELGIKKNGSSHMPEVPPRRGRSNSESNCRVVEKTMRNKELRREGDTSVKFEEIESREVSKICRSQSKNRGPVKGNVSALKEKYDKESAVHRKDVQKCQSVGSTSSEKSKEKRPNDQPVKDKIKHKTIIPKLTVGSPESETCSTIHKQMDLGNKRTSENTSKEECGSRREHNDTQNIQKTIGDLTNNRQEMQDCKVNGTEKEEEGSDKLKELGNSHNKSKGPCKSYVKVETVGEHDDDLTEEVALSLEADQNRKDSITVHDILEQSPSLWSLNGKQTHHGSLPSKEKELSLSHKSERGSQSHLELLSSNAEVYNIKEKADGKVEEDFPKSRMDSFTFSNHESESDISDRIVSPQTDVEKTGWVHCLIESACHLTQISHSTSPKDLPEITQPLSQESRNGEEDLECFKDCVHSHVALPAIPDKSPQPNQPAMHLLSPPATQLTLVKEGKLSVGSVSLSEEEERRSAVSTLSEGVDSFETSAGDTMEDIISSTALADAEGSMAPSERSGSVCSGNDSHGQSKPPAVPPKTEKAMRRAMKLTTRRIQKADAKSKSERKGRSSDKSISHKAERRHHSTDKMEGNRSERRSISDDRHSSKHSKHYLEPKTQRSEKHSRCHSSDKSQNVEQSDPSNKRQDGQPNKVVDSNSHSNEKQHQKSNHMDHLENSNKSNDIDRTSGNNKKYVPKKQERRTQSLDRFSRDKHENKSNSFDKTEAEVHSGLSTEELHYSTSKAPTLRKNSIEHSYAPTANIVAQSFPITQRKLLQDPDSGQYFLVDMPVQVKTKTFFDPETKSYVQLPVQSPEGAVRQAPPLEVMNTPPLVLYHGFVPVPVSSLPSQKSIVRTTGSMITTDDLEDFETGKKQDFYQMQEVHPYIEPAYMSQEHTPEEEIDSVR